MSIQKVASMFFFAGLDFKLLITVSNVFGLVEKPKPITDSKIILPPKPLFATDADKPKPKTRYTLIDYGGL